MAKTTVTTDDLDGSTSAETVEFSLNGVSYTIDLSKKNRTALEKALKPYIDAGKKTTARVRRGGGTGPGRGRARRSTPTLDLAAVRAWAKETGHPVSDRGRIAAPILEAYAAAN